MAAKKRKLKRIRSLTISRRRWLRGGGGSLLENGKMCCLGFGCRAAGVPAKSIDGLGLPNDLDVVVPAFSKTSDSGPVNTVLSERAHVINDDETIDDAQRERLLRALFKRHGVALRFVP